MATPYNTERLRPCELALWLKVTTAYIYQVMKRGELHAFKINEINYISSDEILIWISSHTTTI